MELTKYEKTRIIGARALQIAMGAPILTNREKELNPIRIAIKEFEENVLPISVRRVNPEKVEKRKADEVLPEDDEDDEEIEETGEENKTDEA